LLNFVPSSSRADFLGLPVDIDNQNREARAENPYWPFENPGQWDLAYVCLYPERLSKRRIQGIVVNKYNRSLHGRGFKNFRDFERRVKLLASKGVQFKVYVFGRSIKAPGWAPTSIEVWMRDTLEVVKQLVGNVKWADVMKWAPEEVFNGNNERIFSELWTGNWWKRMQVRLWV
jgi:hypothetical protein